MNPKLRLLVVEDEDAIRNGLIDVFVYHGYDVEGVADGVEGLRRATSGHFDLILLDVMLPGLDGFEVCSRLREQDPDQPVIMLTAKTSDEDIVQGLTLGADDYVAKPFSVAALVLRVQAVLRRSRVSASAQSVVRLGRDTEVDLWNLCGSRGDQSLRFTRREIEVLTYLSQHPQRPVSREELLHKVWGYARDLDIETRTVDIHVAKLRRKIEADPAAPHYLVTVRGAGYRLLVDGDD